jgi:hypothetical protein
VVSQAGARWIAEDRGLYEFPQSGQDVSAQAFQPCLDAQRNIRPCPLYPLREIARLHRSFLDFCQRMRRESAWLS